MVCPRGAGAIRAEALWLEPDRSVANCVEHPGRNTVRQPFGGDSTYIDLLHPALPTWPAPQAQGGHSRHRRRPSGRCLSAVAAKPAINRHSPCRSPACWRSQRGLMPASFRRSRQPAVAWSARGPFSVHALSPVRCPLTGAPAWPDRRPPISSRCPTVGCRGCQGREQDVPCREPHEDAHRQRPV